ncbi:low-specificity L-threonine aldolase [Desulfopila sp. IMCC35006]|uniref:low-specificity L-threonine aldolase n=1 Tax=Desulfopila sp. IMCC35006 TaxID=2569542 RepID=UPI0010AD6AA2|nr:low-specificity L-threonine aldolase [Desulfopila sp. IMCC35006]TKB26846.1 low-specificity L-threonine aldolase [Desulfopila sp. IMCC35006]
MTNRIDLRSDTVTQPSRPMRQAMAEAEVGDDVYRDDPTVNELESYAAQLLGFEAAIFTASGTQANLIGIMSHCGRGDEYIVGQLAHTYRYEAGGAAVLGSIQPQPIEFEPDATLSLTKIEEKIKPDDIHFARTRLLCLENTQNGRVLPLDYLQQVATFAADKKLSLHLDGARLFNAAVKQNVSAREITRHFDSTSVCLSKGLGAPVGSLLCGARSFIEQARKWRKMVGGGMRQAGILAAAGMYALKNNIERLAVDHEHAAILAEGLRRFDQLQVVEDPAQTNMVFFTMEAGKAQQMAEFLNDHNILITPGKTTRLVTHLDISRADIIYTLEKIEEFFTSCKV